MARLLALISQYRLQIRTFIQAITPVLMVVGAGIAFHGFIWAAVEGNLILNSIILLAGLFGAGIMLYNLFEFQREHVAILYFNTEAQSGADMRDLLDEPSLSKRSVRRYLEHIAHVDGKLSSSLDQDAIENEMHAIAADFDARLELPNFLVGFMIALGLLGTFIGLLETLTGISGMLNGMSGGSSDAVEQEFMKLVGELRKPLAGMGIAFSASMFGLVGSLMLGMILLTVRRYTRTIMADARTVFHELTERIRGPVHQGAMAGVPSMSVGGGISGDFLSGFMGELTSNINDLQDLFHRSQGASLQLSNRVDTLAQRLELVSQAIENNVAAVKKTNDLLGFGPRMKETNEQMLSELQAMQQSAANNQRISNRLVDTLNAIDQKLGVGNDAQRLYQDAQATVSRDMITRLDEAVGILHSVNDRGSESDSKIDRKIQSLVSSSNNIASNLQTLSAKMSEVAMIGQSQLQSASSSQQIMRDATSEVLSSFKDLGDRVKKVEDIDIGATRHLFEIKEHVSGIGSTSEVMEQISQSINRQSSLLEVMLEEMRTNQRNATRDMQKQFREMSREIARETAREIAAATAAAQQTVA